LQTVVPSSAQISHILRDAKWDSRVCIELNKTLRQGKGTGLKKERINCGTTPTGTRRDGFMLQVEMLSSTAQKFLKNAKSNL